MQTQVEGQVGPQVLQDGSVAQVRQDRQGSLVVVESHGRYYEQAYRKNLFSVNIAAGSVTTAATSMTGLMLFNPPFSTVNLAVVSVWAAEMATTASLTGMHLGYWYQGSIAYGATTKTAITTTITNNFLGGPAPNALAFSALNAIALAPTKLYDVLHSTVAIATTGEDPGGLRQLDSGLIVPPGYGICLVAVGASTSSATDADITWEEVPV